MDPRIFPRRPLVSGHPGSELGYATMSTKNERRWRPFAAATLLLVMLSVPSRSWAQSDEERAGARTAARDGAKAFNEGRWADAVDLFSRAQALVKAPPHLLYIARAQEKLGQLVKARENYLQVKRMQLADDAPAAFTEAKQAAEAELAVLEPRLPYVTVNVQGAGDAPVTVTMNGAQIPSALVGVRRPVDPGDHKFQAFAKGMESDVVTVSVKESAKEIVALTLVAKPGAAGAPPVTGPDQTPEQHPGGETPPPDAGASPNGMRIGGYVALGVGAVGLIGGTYFALSASSKRGEADDLCTLPGAKCPEDKKSEIESLDEDAKSASTLAVAGFVIGGLGVATGVTLLLLAPKSQSARAPALRVTPWIGYKSAGVVGRF